MADFSQLDGVDGRKETNGRSAFNQVIGDKVEQVAGLHNLVFLQSAILVLDRTDGSNLKRLWDSTGLDGTEKLEVQGTNGCPNLFNWSSNYLRREAN